MSGHYADYTDGDAICEAYVARPDGAGPHPAVLVAHQWSGQSDHERGTADRLAELGYVGIAIDVYGKGTRGDPNGDNGPLIGPWLADRAGLRRRLLAAVAFAKGHDAVDASRIAIMGDCFGGLCALDVARSGTPDVRGAISIHGIFPPPNIGPQGDMTASVLVLHGWEDPMAPPADVAMLAEELTDARCDWQLHAYGHALHAFTAPEANAPERGLKYDAAAANRSWVATTRFLGEIFS